MSPVDPWTYPNGVDGLLSGAWSASWANAFADAT